MKNPGQEKMRLILHNQPNYKEDKQGLLDIIQKYNHADLYQLQGLLKTILKTAIEKDWSRRKLDCILDDLLKEGGAGFSDTLSDYMIDFLEAIEGKGFSDPVIRLNGEPENNEVLYAYIRSGKWRNEDRY